MIDKIKNMLISNRFKSFYWRSAMMILAGFLSLISASLTELEISSEITVMAGLILGEISKHINKTYLS